MNKFDQWLDAKFCAAFDWNERTQIAQIIVIVAVTAAVLIWIAP